MLYSAELWPVSVTQMKKLEPAHHRWQRSILGISWKDNGDKVRKSWAATALPKLEDIIRCRRLRWLGHLSRMECHRIPRQAHRWEPDGFTFRRRPGRPRQNWWGVITHQQGSQEHRDRTGRGTGGNGGQEKLVDSCRPMRLWRRMNQESGILLPQWIDRPVTWTNQRITELTVRF